MDQINLNHRYYYDELAKIARTLSKKYPFYVRYEVIGTSLDGRDIFMLQAGNGPRRVILTAGVHGRETVNPVVLLSMVQEYCECRTDRLEEYTLFVVPLLNPDGYMIALRGFNILKGDQLRIPAKSKGIPYILWKYNANAVDLNRNFPSKTWVKKGAEDEAGSEPETKTLIKLFKEAGSDGYIDYHSRGRSIYYYRNSMPDEYNAVQYKLAGWLCMMTNYMLVPRQDEIERGDSGGNTVHYYSEVIQKPTFTIETVEDAALFPLDYRYQAETFHEIADTPFIFQDSSRDSLFETVTTSE